MKDEKWLLGCCFFMKRHLKHRVLLEEFKIDDGEMYVGYMYVKKGLPEVDIFEMSPLTFHDFLWNTHKHMRKGYKSFFNCKKRKSRPNIQELKYLFVKNELESILGKGSKGLNSLLPKMILGTKDIAISTSHSGMGWIFEFLDNKEEVERYHKTMRNNISFSDSYHKYLTKTFKKIFRFKGKLKAKKKKDCGKTTVQEVHI